MKLALGTVQFGLKYGIANTKGVTTAQDARAILEHARKVGIDTLDTAIAYGRSETVLGDIGISDWKVITKLPAVPETCDNVALWVNDQIRQSITRLGIKKLHGVLLHRPDQLLEPIGARLYSALLDAKAKDLTLNIGISVYDLNDLTAILSFCKPDIIQAPLNILDRSLVESDWLSRLRSAGIELHSRSTFLQGLLLMHPSQRPSKFVERWPDIWDVWDVWLASNGLTPLQACIRYAVNQSEVDRIIVGMDTAVQLHQIVEAAKGSLTSLPDFPILKDGRLIDPSSWGQL